MSSLASCLGQRSRLKANFSWVHFKLAWDDFNVSSEIWLVPIAQFRHSKHSKIQRAERLKALLKACKNSSPPLILSLFRTGFNNTRHRASIYCTLKDPWTRTLAAITILLFSAGLQWLFL